MKWLRLANYKQPLLNYMQLSLDVRTWQVAMLITNNLPGLYN